MDAEYSIYQLNKARNNLRDANILIGINDYDRALERIKFANMLLVKILPFIHEIDPAIELRIAYIDINIETLTANYSEMADIMSILEKKI